MRLRLRRSRGLLLYLIVSHCAAIGLAWMSGINVMAAISLSLLIVFSLMKLSRSNGWFGGTLAIAEFRLSNDRYGYTIDAKGQIQGPYLTTQSVILGPLVAITLKSESISRKNSIVITRDAVDSEAWRQLCLRLRDPEFWG